MTIFEDKLREFEGFHLSMSNRLCHYLGLVLVTVGALGLLHQFEIVEGVSAAWVLLLLTVVFDLLTWTRIALPLFIVGAFLLGIASSLSMWTNMVVLSLGLVVQVAAHRVFEKNAPAFTTNMIHNHIGPRWLVIQFGQLFGFTFGYNNHLRLNTDVTDSIRWALSKLIPLIGNLATKKMLSKITDYQSSQHELKKTYHVSETKILSYSEDLREKIIQKQQSEGGVFAFTSGSTSKPKQILYTTDRLKLFKKSSALSSLQGFHLMKVTNPSMFIFASLQKDDSFASLVVSSEVKAPSFLSGIIEPAKYLNHPLVKRISETHGANGARLWVMAMNSPGALYSTNPSTLAVFFEDIDSNWPNYRQLFTDFLSGSGCFDTIKEDPEWVTLICGLGRGDYAARINALSVSERLPSLETVCPDLKGYICWDGGYVTGFLEKIRHYLPVDKYLHVPMFSMSTETMQTELLVQDDLMHFVPTGEQVLYEFLPIECDDDQSEKLLLATDLSVGHLYTMVVSDPWGLQRYQTQDVFKCVDKVNGVADIRFQKRRGLNYSFTGEKITGEQVEEAIQSVVTSNMALKKSGIQFTLIPSSPEMGLPNYILLAANASGCDVGGFDLSEIAAGFSRNLGEINQEYNDKLESGRLGAIECKLLAYDDVAFLLDPKTNKNADVDNRSWESQFKLTPITSKLWQDLPTEMLKTEASVC